MHEQILTMLAGSHSQQPMQFNALLDISGLQPDTLNMVLDQMYAAHSINQATVTRSGIMQREVWPTGMAKQVNIYADLSKRVAATPPPRRNEVQVIKTKEITMTQDLEVAEQTPKALTILKFIEANPNCNSAQISHATGIESPHSYIKAHISRGNVLVKVLDRRNSHFNIALGQTAQGIYGYGYTKRQPAPSAALLAEVQSAHANVDLPVGRVGFQPHAVPCRVGNELPTLPLPTLDLSEAYDADIPAFISKRADELPAVKYDADLGFYSTELITSQPTLQAHIDALFMLLPESATICITRNNAQLEIDIEADVFGKTVAKSVQTHEVKETLAALHIVTVEMA